MGGKNTYFYIADEQCLLPKLGIESEFRRKFSVPVSSEGMKYVPHWKLVKGRPTYFLYFHKKGDVDKKDKHSYKVPNNYFGDQ